MKRSPLLSVSIRYGVVAGILTFILMAAMYYLGRHPLLIAPYLDFRILLFGVFIFFTLKEFRDYHQGEVLYFWQGLIGGGLVVIIASIISALGFYLFGSWQETFVSDYVRLFTEYLKTFSPEAIEGIGKDVYESNLKALPATNILELAKTYFRQGIVIGFFVNIILSVILRKQPKI